MEIRHSRIIILSYKRIEIGSSYFRIMGRLEQHKLEHRPFKRNHMKVRVTYNIPEEVEDLLTEIYIKRLKNKSKSTRSDIVAEAITLFAKWEGRKL